jgi:outer membrane biosynthesis protein TonB
MCVCRGASLFISLTLDAQLVKTQQHVVAWIVIVPLCSMAIPQFISQWKDEQQPQYVRQPRREPGMTPEESPKPQEPSVKPIPKSKPIKRDPTVKGASPGSPSQPNSGPVAIAPNGIANAAPNFGNQTVNNAPPSRHLSEDRNAFISCIALKPGRFSIGAIENDQEAYNYAQEWRDVLVAARWEIEHKDIPIQIFTIGGGMGGCSL